MVEIITIIRSFFIRNHLYSYRAKYKKISKQLNKKYLLSETNIMTLDTLIYEPLQKEKILSVYYVGTNIDFGSNLDIENIKKYILSNYWQNISFLYSKENIYLYRLVIRMLYKINLPMLGNNSKNLLTKKEKFKIREKDLFE